nr:MAG TPA: Prokaryotic membrane lipoprotein lipid attachment site [Caudoviricetes sp.]
MHYMKKILLMIATCLTLTACGDDIVSIKDNDYSFFGHLEIQALSKKPLSNADIMLSDFRGRDDLKSVTLWIDGEKSESKCLSDTAILLNDKKLRPITVKLEKKDEQELSYSAKYSFDDYLEFFAKNNKVMISSCGINHVLTEDEKGGLARITKAWIKFTDKK